MPTFDTNNLLHITKLVLRNALNVQISYSKIVLVTNFILNKNGLYDGIAQISLLQMAVNKNRDLRFSICFLTKIFQSLSMFLSR